MEMIQISKEEYEALKGLVSSLTAKVAELEAKLNKNSKNSNKPPSSDGLKKGTVKNKTVGFRAAKQAETTWSRGKNERA